jgi:hypothetical protein
MNRFLQEFFWTPDETIDWIKRVARSLNLWVVLWAVANDAQKVDADQLRPDMFEGLEEDTLQLFLGSFDLSTEPAWREVQGRRLLDFQRSYAVQLVPAVIAPDHKTLLQGRLAILRPDQYDDQVSAKKLFELFRRLKASMKNESDRDRVVTQVSSSGGKKLWKDILVGKHVPGGRVTQLKQFSKAPVVFSVEPE